MRAIEAASDALYRDAVWLERLAGPGGSPRSASRKSASPQTDTLPSDTLRAAAERRADAPPGGPARGRGDIGDGGWGGRRRAGRALPLPPGRRHTRFRGNVPAHLVRCRPGPRHPRPRRLGPRRGAPDPDHPPRAASRPRGPRPWMSLPRMWLTLLRRAPRSALGPGRGDEPGEHSAALPAPSPAGPRRGMASGVGSDGGAGLPRSAGRRALRRSAAASGGSSGSGRGPHRGAPGPRRRARLGDGREEMADGGVGGRRGG